MIVSVGAGKATKGGKGGKKGGKVGKGGKGGKKGEKRSNEKDLDQQMMNYWKGDPEKQVRPKYNLHVMR